MRKILARRHAVPVGEESETTIIGGGLHEMYVDFFKIILSNCNVMQNCQREGGKIAHHFWM